MIKIYGMDTCPDCTFVKEQIKDRTCEFKYIDIGSHVRLLKEFLRIRDGSPVFDEAREEGYAGIPCFVFEDGRVSIKPEDAGLKESSSEAQSCSIEDHRNGKKGC